MSSARIGIDTKFECQQLGELAKLLEKQIAAACADDILTAEILAEKCSVLVAQINHAGIFKCHCSSEQKRKIETLYRRLECILADKTAVTQQQLCFAQQGQKLLDAYRP
jgi:hypothetical protein